METKPESNILDAGLRKKVKEQIKVLKQMFC